MYDFYARQQNASHVLAIV